MTRHLHHGAFAALLVLVTSGCAHRAPRHDDGIVWPMPPELPRARWSGSFPGSTREGPSLWSRVATVVTGAPEEHAAGDGPAALQRPFGVSMAGGALFVADQDAGEVLRVEWERRSATRLGCEGRSWTAPIGVAAISERVAYVVDGAEVLRWTPDACTVLQGHTVRPTAVAAEGGRVYVVDSGSNEVVVFEEEREVARFGASGPAEARLHGPVAISVDPTDGTLLVVDALNFRVCRFERDGRFVGSFGHASNDHDGFVRPKAVAVDEAGRLFVVDGYRDRVLVYDRSGEYAFSIGAPGTVRGHLSTPSGLDVSGTALYVANSGNGRVDRFDLLEEP